MCPHKPWRLLNDPFVLDQAGFWADNLIKAQAPTVESRLDSMFRTALGRLPDEGERTRFAGLAKELVSLHKAAPEKILESREVWKDMAHAVFNLKEFTYLR